VLHGHFTKLQLQDAVSVSSRVVLTSQRNNCSEVFALTDEDRAFQERADATVKARSPSVERCVVGSIRIGHPSMDYRLPTKPPKQNSLTSEAGF